MHKTSDSLDKLCIEKTNVDDTPRLLSNKVLAFDIRFDSRKMNDGFNG